ncbi:MAG: hypothetical protein ACTHJM_07280 [Marmoricola sp.]
MGEWRQAAHDTSVLLRFRTGHLRGRAKRRARIALAAVLTVTFALAWLPQYLPQGRPTRIQALVLTPTAYLSFLLLTAIAATVAGGGRQLLTNDEASPYPISAKTDFLVGLVLAPLNIAWLMESWTLLAAMSYGYGRHWQLGLAQVVTLGWIATATVVGQMLAGLAEWVRRLRGGVLVVRAAGVALAATSGWLVVSGRLGHWLDRGYLTKWVLDAQLRLSANHWWHGLIALTVFAAIVSAAVWVGGWAADRASRHQAVDELKLESGQRVARPNPVTDFIAMLRIDRASVWRAVPLRRGILFLGVLPGAVALAGSLHWQVITMFPGLVCSGGALLFGVNIWCLDAKGAFWRESLPASPGLAFAVRSWVLGELLLVSLIPAIGLGALRAGVPTLSEVASVFCVSVVTVVFVTGRCLRWSITKPYPADLRGARATPAPPVAMVGYSARLALTTTLLGLVFMATAVASWEWSVIVALPVVFFAGSDLAHTARLWESAETRAHVLTAVST